mmetsp:Transcript_88440/g.211136  ORF Transcript_88440/g.211136 Transcript_88440/m.211136 type:complete len:223 (+) Transcript_88440:1720-2388(+)
MGQEEVRILGDGRGAGELPDFSVDPLAQQVAVGCQNGSEDLEVPAHRRQAGLRSCPYFVLLFWKHFDELLAAHAGQIHRRRGRMLPELLQRFLLLLRRQPHGLHCCHSHQHLLTELAQLALVQHGRPLAQKTVLWVELLPCELWDEVLAANIWYFAHSGRVNHLSTAAQYPRLGSLHQHAGELKACFLQQRWEEKSNEDMAPGNAQQAVQQAKAREEEPQAL